MYSIDIQQFGSVCKCKFYGHASWSGIEYTADSPPPRQTRPSYETLLKNRPQSQTPDARL